MDDISQRAIKNLSDVDLIAAEDTRHTAKLLSHLGLSKRTFALHDHNEKQKAPGTHLATARTKRSAGERRRNTTDKRSCYALVSLCREQGLK